MRKGLFVFTTVAGSCEDPIKNAHYGGAGLPDVTGSSRLTVGCASVVGRRSPLAGRAFRSHPSNIVGRSTMTKLNASQMKQVKGGKVKQRW